MNVTQYVSIVALDKFLAHHARTCTYWIFSGDRHCSCGREEALKELEQIRALIDSMHLPLFAEMDLQ